MQEVLKVINLAFEVQQQLNKRFLQILEIETTLLYVKIYNLQEKQKMRITTVFIYLLLLVFNVRSCFIVHFVYYAGLPMYYFDRFVNFPHPYTFHYNEPINWIKGFKVNRVMSYVEQADIKRMEVLYNYGGVYLDSDMLVDIECLKEKLCTKKEDRLYLMDWVYKDSEKWLKSVPIAFLYAPRPKIPVFQRILTSYNQAIDQTVKFSGPYYIQNFKDQLGFIKFQQHCQSHMGTQTFFGTNPQFNWIYDSYERSAFQNKNKQQQQKRDKKINFFKQLWQTKSVIYPANFNYQQFGQFNPQFNHVELIDKQRLIIKIIKYSNNSQTKQKILHLLQVSRINQDKFNNQLNLNRLNYNIEKENSRVQLFESQQQQITYIYICLGIILLILLFIKLIKNIKNKQCLNNQNSNNQLLNNHKDEFQSQSNFKAQNYKQYQKQNFDFKTGNNILKYFLIGFFVCSCVIITYLIYKQLTQSIFQKIKSPLSINEVRVQVKQQEYHQQFQMQTKRMLQYNKNYRKMYGIQIKNISIQPIEQVPLNQIGFVDNIQIDSKFDYLNIKNRKEFQLFKQTFQDSITYDVFEFNYNQSLEKPKQYIKYVEFNSSSFFQFELQNMNNWSGGQKLPQNLKTYLASYLVYNKTTKRVKQLQHYYYNKLYKIDSIPDEIPMCVLSTGYQVYSKGKYQRFFESIEQQNYSNYHIVIIDDKSPDNSGIHFYEHLKNTTFKLKNRVKIIRNHVNVGGLANMYIYAKKFCNENDIVLNIDTDDMLIGHQVFNVLNSVYQDPNIWYAYTRYFSQSTPQSLPVLGLFSLPITVNISENRLAPQWNTSHMRTYRQQLMAKIPIEQFIEYFHDKKHNMFLPRFYTFAQDRFTVYAQLQISGNQRIKFIDHPLYFYDQSGTSKVCHYQYGHFVEYKSRIKRIMKPLNALDQNVQYYPDKNLSSIVKNKLKSNYELFRKCMKFFYEKNSFV